MIDLARFEQVRTEWQAATRVPTPDAERFRTMKTDAEELVAAGRWASGPSDLLSVLGRSRDELIHSRMIAWLLVPTNRHGLGRRFLTGFADRLWPDDQLLRAGPILVETEESGSAIDDVGELREARADIVIRSGGVTIVVENKVDAGEQPQQCERLYWAWASEAADARYVFLTPSGRTPTTIQSDAARSGWKAMSYANLRDVLASALDGSDASPTSGRSTARQYLDTLTLAVVPRS